MKQFITMFLLVSVLIIVAIIPSVQAQNEQAETKDSVYKSIESSSNKPSKVESFLRGLDLDASVVIDTFYYHDDSEEGLAHIKEEISGFGHAHSAEEDEHDHEAEEDEHHHEAEEDEHDHEAEEDEHDHETEEHGHDHAGIENGFNLRHIELGLSAAVDPYFRAFTTLAFEDGNSEIEEAVIQTTSLPYALTLSGGKFYSGIGRINRQHSHGWDFFDQPLLYELLFGSHGLQQKGVQLTWLAPAPFYLLVGAEAANGDNEKMFQSLDAEELPSKDAPRLWTGFLKFGPDLGDRHAAQFGLSFAYGDKQEAHDGNGDGADDHWLDGNTTLWGIDAVYKFNSERPHGQGDIVIQAEYFNRLKDLEIVQHDLMPAFTGRSREDHQDGYYIQGLYGFAPRWRAGLRWEQIGLINDVKLPDLTEENFDSSSRASFMIDWKLSEFSVIRAQANRGEYETEEGSEDVWEYVLQLQVTFGKHAAHTF